VRDYSRFDRFIDSLHVDVYPEPPSEPGTTIIRTTVQWMRDEGFLMPGMRILDVGCGQGVALRHFVDLGMDAVGVALGADVEVCRAAGFNIIEADQNFIDCEGESFDFLWCRHVLEHSIAPLFTLSEYHRLTRVGGHVYVEVPAPDTSAHHELNPNHYSVFGLSSWASLFARAGLSIVKAQGLNVQVGCGPDTYWSFLLKRDG